MWVAIVGCGYVGVELGRRLSAAGHDVVGVRRSPDGIETIREAGFEGIRADVSDPESLEAVPDVDAVVYSVSAGGRGAEAARRAYVETQATAIEAFGTRERPPDRWIYTGSTGVYGDHDGAWVDESTDPRPDGDRGRNLLRAESIARERTAEYGIDGAVVRFAGLYGPGRFRLQRYLEGPVAGRHLNLFHRDDAAGAVAYLLERNLVREGVILGVDDEPVWRPDLAEWLAEQCNAPAPATITVEERLEDVADPGRRNRIAADKRCSNDTLRELGYELEYPTYRDGYREAVRAYRSTRE